MSIFILYPFRLLTNTAFHSGGYSFVVCVCVWNSVFLYLFPCSLVDGRPVCRRRISDVISIGPKNNPYGSRMWRRDILRCFFFHSQSAKA